MKITFELNTDEDFDLAVLRAIGSVAANPTKGEALSTLVADGHIRRVTKSRTADISNAVSAAETDTARASDLAYASATAAVDAAVSASTKTAKSAPVIKESHVEALVPPTQAETASPTGPTATTTTPTQTTAATTTSAERAAFTPETAHALTKEDMMKVFQQFISHPWCGGPRALAGVLGRYGDETVSKPTGLSGPTALPVASYPALKAELEKIMATAKAPA